MPYIINRFDGSRLIVIDDGILDNTYPVGLVGRNYTGWGEVFNENFIFILENFRGISPPPRALEGQAWYDSSNKVLKAFDGEVWNPIGNAEISETSPTITRGGLWLKSTTDQLFVSVDGQWKLVGPEGIEGFGLTRVKSELIKDKNDQSFPVIVSYVDGQPISIFSSSAFEISSDNYLGFSKIEIGLNFRSDTFISGTLKGNSDTTTALKTSRNINGVPFDGTQNIVIKSSTTNPLKKGDYIVGTDWDGTLTDTWSVDATPENRIGKVVARDANGEFSAELIRSNLVGDVQGNVRATSGTSFFTEITATRITAPDFVGNSSSATRLRTPRKINTVNFDGTVDITLPVPAGTLTGNFLAPNVLSSSLTSLGKLTSLDVEDTGILISRNDSRLRFSIDQFIPTIRSELSNTIKLELLTGSSQTTDSNITYISAASTSLIGISGPALVPDWTKVVPNNQKINLGLPNNQWNTVYSNNFKGIELSINRINSESGQVSFGGSVSVSGAVSSTFVGNLTGNVTGNLTGNVTGASSLNLLKSGDTMSGNINWSTTNRGIGWAMNTDFASIRFYNTGDGDTDSRLEFNTGDNGNEYFRWTHTRSGGVGLFESMRLMPNSPNSSELTVSGRIISTGNITASNFSGIGTEITNLDANKITLGRISNARLTGSYDISISGNATTVSSITSNQVVSALGYTPVKNTGDRITGDILIDKPNAWLTLDSPSVGSNGSDQAAGISIGESGYKGSATFHITYTGDGFAHIGMGSVNASTSIMAFRAMRLYYLNNNVDFYGTINVPTVNATTLIGAGSAITNLNASSLSTGTVPVARLNGTYDIGITGNAATVSSITSNQVTTALGYTPANVAGSIFSGDIIVGATNKASNSLISVRAGDLYRAGFEAHGAGQGTGYLYIGQSTSFGGGVSYNGDNNPAFVQGELPDRITFFRRNAGVSSSVFHYAYNSDNVFFSGNISAPTFSGSGAAITNLNANNLVSGIVPVARLNGTYNINITGNAVTVSSITSNQVTTALGYTPANVSGGTLSGDWNWNSTNRGLNWAFNTDGASIRFYNTGDGDTDSRLEFETRDNGNEYFRWTHTRSGGVGLFESMRLVPNSFGNSVLTVSGSISATNAISAPTFSGSGAAITNLNANNLVSGTVPVARLNGTYNINITGTATTAVTADSATNISGGVVNATSAEFTGDITIKKLNPTIFLNHFGDPGVDLAIRCEGENFVIFEPEDNNREWFRINDNNTAPGFSSAFVYGKEILDRVNYTKYAPSLTGTGASGTWPINISGTANSVSTITGSQVISALGFTPVSTISNQPGGPIIGTSAQFQSVLIDSVGNAEIRFNSRGDPNVDLAISVQGENFVIYEPDDGNREWFRINDTGTFGSASVYGQTILDARNYTNYTVTKTGTGSSGTWPISITGNAGTVSNITSSQIINALGYAPVNPSNLTNQAGAAITGSNATFSGVLNVSAGSGGGIRFPNDAFGGGGDTATVTLETKGGEATRLTLRVTNDGDDTIEFFTPARDGVRSNGHIVLHAANYNDYTPTRSGGGAFGSWPINITGQASTVNTITSSQIIGALGFTPISSVGNQPGGPIIGTSAQFQSVLIDNVGNAEIRFNSRGDPNIDLAISVQGENFIIYEPDDGNREWFRINDTGTFGSASVYGQTILDARNYTDYTVTKTGTGSSGTWPINITGQASTVNSITSGQIVSALGYIPANGSGAGLINGEQNYQDNLLRRPTLIDYSVWHNALGSRSGSVNINYEQGNYVSVTAVGAINWSFTNPPTGPRAGGIILELTNGGSFTQNWPSSVRWPSGIAPLLSSSGIDVLVFITDDAGLNWRGAISISDSR
jgi:hypothetical protein